jgi:hypothetical protein
VIVQGTSVGLDVHALSVVAHAVDEETGKIARARLCPDHGDVLGSPPSWGASCASSPSGTPTSSPRWLARIRWRWRPGYRCCPGHTNVSSSTSTR